MFLQNEIELYALENTIKHNYSFACSGMKVASKEFSTRDSATKYMYKICSKYNLVVRKVYRDNHDITYVCDNGIKFYIQRVW